MQKIKFNFTRQQREKIIQESVRVQQDNGILRILTKKYLDHLFLELQVVQIGSQTMYRSLNKRKYKLYPTWPQAFIALKPLVTDIPIACYEWEMKEQAKRTIHRSDGTTHVLKLVGGFT